MGGVWAKVLNPLMILTSMQLLPGRAGMWKTVHSAAVVSGDQHTGTDKTATQHVLEWRTDALKVEF